MELLDVHVFGLLSTGSNYCIYRVLHMYHSVLYLISLLKTADLGPIQRKGVTSDMEDAHTHLCTSLKKEQEESYYYNHGCIEPLFPEGLDLYSPL
ncbi:hypothetical protein GDO86_011064 [Hymenochirus boettgeri]|uniref:Uncharacterized protein n=1 Tax=Hymenochirus boettgeri TaxID=247094 RepID=A0A8T2JF38_9PIPI|nr:hypothetical protein GDO86_011064 [Hymenochirus boettgeri]